MGDGLELIDPGFYAAHGYPHESWARLRREAPVERFTPAGWDPFWAITKHADIREISKRPDRFLNAPGIFLMSDEMRAAYDPTLGSLRTIIGMDPPEHRPFRKVASPWFTPNQIARVDPIVEASARALWDELAGEGGECDFVTQVASRHPLRVLCTLLGVPPEDEPFILNFTNQIFGNDDPEFRSSPDHRESNRKLGLEVYQYFSKIIKERRAQPGEDLASVLANGVVDGQPLGELETFGYYLIAFTAGHETTRNAISGGMLALLEHPDELSKLRRDPGLASAAVEEIVRWGTPVNYMKRTAACDVELRGRKIREGEGLLLFYASANRDEEVFADPNTFRIERSPNPHLGFGIGEHFCLGASLARRSAVALFRELARRRLAVELAGEPVRVRSSFVAGLKHLPIRTRAAPA